MAIQFLHGAKVARLFSDEEPNLAVACPYGARVEMPLTDLINSGILKIDATFATNNNGGMPLSTNHFFASFLFFCEVFPELRGHCQLSYTP